MALVTCELPSDYAKNFVNQLAEKENFKEFSLAVTTASKKGDNYLGDLFRIKITGTKSDGEHDSMSVILKLAPDNDAMRDFLNISKFYSREIYVYSVLLPALDVIREDLPEADKVHFAGCLAVSKVPPREALLLKDLTVHGFVMRDRLESCDMEHMELSLRKLATFHALGFALKERQPDVFQRVAANTCRGVDLGVMFNKLAQLAAVKAIAVIEDARCKEKLQKFCDNFSTNFEKLVSPDAVAPYDLICHGDCWSNNILYKYEGGRPVDLRFLDWQLSRNASPIIDFSYMVCTSTDEAFRRQHWRHILDCYHDTLSQRMASLGLSKDTFPREVFEDHVKRILPYGLCMAIIVLPLILCDRDNPFDLEKMLNQSEVGDENKLSDTCVRRLQDLVQFFVDEELI